MTQAIALNNAIHRLSFQNPDSPEVMALARDWQSWFEDVRPWVPAPVEYATLEVYWRRYQKAFDTAQHKRDIPAPAALEPRFFRSVKENVDERVMALQDAGRAAQRLTERTAERLQPSLLPFGIGVGVAATIGIIWLSRKAAA